ITEIDKSFDGAFGIKFTNLSSDTKFIIFVCYLPPENSSRGRDAQSFFAHLLTQIYTYSDCDNILLLGDFNSRIGALSETLCLTDNVPKRDILDKSINQHGHEFVEFLNEAKFCVLNGRFALNDNFTSISRKGKAVVDYICVPHDSFNDFRNFKVLTTQDIVDNNNLQGLIGDKSKLPDHSVITCEFKVTHCNLVNNTESSNQSNTPSRHRLDRIPLDFMSSDLMRQTLLNLIGQIEHSRETQENVDKIYDNLCNLIIAEMDDKIPKTSSNKSNRRHKHTKPYWNDTLKDLWNAMRMREKDFLACTGNRHRKTAIRQEYIQARDIFDKTLRKTEREYRRLKAVDIETMSTKNPSEFWEKIKKLGPTKDTTIPMEIINENGYPVRTESDVLKKWRFDFQNLYNGSNSDEIQQRTL
ncbi:Hypothetical predicted protein, partial [Mytilus galloprovincialis]